MDWAIRILGRIPLAKRMVGLLFQRHLHQIAAVEMVARELAYNAVQMIPNRGATTRFAYVHFDAWKSHRLDIHLRLRGNPELWEAVCAAYDDLYRMEHGATPPTAERLDDVSVRMLATVAKTKEKRSAVAS